MNLNMDVPKPFMDKIKVQLMPEASDTDLFLFAMICNDLELNPFIHEIDPVPYKIKLSTGGSYIRYSYQISRDGYMKIANRNPNFLGLNSFLVYSEDDFEIDLGTNHVKHIIKNDKPRTGLKGAWGIAKKYNPASGQTFEYVQYCEFQTYYIKNEFWDNWKPQMILKTVDKMILKKATGVEEPNIIPEMENDPRPILENGNSDIIVDKSSAPQLPNTIPVNNTPAPEQTQIIKSGPVTVPEPAKLPNIPTPAPMPKLNIQTNTPAPANIIEPAKTTIPVPPGLPKLNLNLTPAIPKIESPKIDANTEPAKVEPADTTPNPKKKKTAKSKINEPEECYVWHDPINEDDTKHFQGADWFNSQKTHETKEKDVPLAVLKIVTVRWMEDNEILETKFDAFMESEFQPKYESNDFKGTSVEFYLAKIGEFLTKNPDPAHLFNALKVIYVANMLQFIKKILEIVSTSKKSQKALDLYFRSDLKFTTGKIDWTFEFIKSRKLFNLEE